MSLSCSLVDKVIKLKSKDGQSFPIKLNATKKSVVFSRLIEDLALDTETGEVEIPVPNLASEELKKVIEYLEYHVDDNSPSSYCNSLKHNQLSDFDASFIQMERQLLLKIFNAANYLDSEMLKDLCGWAIAESIKNKNYAEINKYWGMTNDFSAEEQLAIQNEYDWINQ